MHEEERKFLHDISNQLVVAQGMGAMVLKKIALIEGIDGKIVERQEKTINAVNMIIEMLKKRRAVIIAETEAE